MSNDRQLQQDVIAELGWDAAVNASRIGVEAKNGIITLSGHVESYAQKWAAERAAQRVGGVKGVAVEMDVVLPGSSQRTDADIASAARNALEWNVLVPRDAVAVMVEDGHITLSGDVEWAYVRSAAESSVRGLQGVKDVSNLIRIRPQIKPSDVKTKIEAALQRRAHLDARSISVDVDKGTVTLAGTVDSLAERVTVENAVWNAPGVQKVVDNLIVAR
ncbi:BON domain-containing protein [Dyella ginsengisoli]|jgi:osmotically-inducible protein OsmY|uniref:BON domain-containing protein n=1 Tax=Dyella ginsengisoli TaxID=363848 RepID=A0ABW8JV52_9GAMM